MTVADATHAPAEDADLAGRTLPELLAWRVATSPEREAYRHFDPASGTWKSHSWRAIDDEIARWRRALRAENLAPGDRVAILMPNGIEHAAMDQAALSLGLVPVPLHAIDNPESICYILRDCAGGRAAGARAYCGGRPELPGLRKRRAPCGGRPNPGPSTPGC